ncbi:uncharacterized protein LOC131646719 isoform X2 [Vicia villosa]|uniref:uncharacterized protein LOC131646719 isoform X2 n=1 Tax=Vicia villosa TaxID=3911 RepID=UPI00273B488D|nr:uncharacterized protein LOC131646719 isoform X2 [Vicia villosa]
MKFVVHYVFDMEHESLCYVSEQENRSSYLWRGNGLRVPFNMHSFYKQRSGLWEANKVCEMEAKDTNSKNLSYSPSEAIKILLPIKAALVVLPFQQARAHFELFMDSLVCYSHGSF